MAYEARKNDGNNNLRKEQDHQNAKNTTKTLAKGTGAYFGGSLGAKAVDIASKTKAGDKILDIAAKRLERAPGFKKVNNKLNESGAVEAADKAIDAKSSKGSINEGTDTNNPLNKNPNQVKNKNNVGGEGKDALPSSLSSENINKNNVNNQMKQEENTEKPSFIKNNDDDQKNKKDSSASGIIKFSKNTKMMIAVLAPSILVVLLLFTVLSFISNYTSDYEDAFGISYNTDRETGGIEFSASSEEQQEFFDRIKEVENDYLSNGKTIDPVRIIAVYNVLINNKANIDYDDMTKSAIEEIADSMLNAGSYDEETFKTNLINSIFPKYLPNSSQELRESMAEEVLEFVENYNDIIEKEDEMSLMGCSEAGSCAYSIKGFYIKGKGNISKKMDISNLYVRLMQCGTGNGHDYGGTFGKPLEGEELVPFEKYILGVAYQEIGPSAPAEAIKAQMVAARSYILARHVDMGGWRTLKKEGNRWILQAASCTQDQVYCDPDKGCSSKDGQWSQVHSGSGHGTILKKALAKNSPLRTYASQTSGEVLVNSKGNVVYSGYTSTEQNKMSTLAKNGLNYKQILLQVYNQGDRNYGATDISKASCTTKASTNCATSTGEFARWKQMGAPWSGVPMGNSGQNIGQIGCLVTSISMLIAKSGVPTTVNPFNPGTFVQKLNNSGGFNSVGEFTWYPVTSAAPKFKFQGKVPVSGLSKEQKLNKLKQLISQPNVYVVAEVKGNTGQHWVAIDNVNGNTINMLDPGSSATNMWKQYNWANTSTYAYFRVS